MIRLIREWNVSRTLDSGAAPRGRDRLSLVHEALRTTHPALRETTPGLHDRTLDAVRRASRRRSPSRPFLTLHLVMAALLLGCALIGVYAVLAPQAARTPTEVTLGGPTPAGPEGGEPAASNLFGGSLKLAGLWQEIAKVTEESVQAPARQEAEHLVADARRATDFVLVKIPFVSRDEAKQ
jgi:hypothetical protein